MAHHRTQERTIDWNLETKRNERKSGGIVESMIG
jgi:hypothetical protein